MLPVLAVLVPAGASSAAAAVPAGTGGLFVPATGRLVDTRSGLGGHTGASTAWRTYSPLGKVGIPSSGVSAIQVTLTVLTPTTTGAGLVNFRPTGGASSFTALVYGGGPGGTAGNTAIIPLSTTGQFDVKTGTSEHLLVDVQGYFTAGQAAGGGYVPLLEPARIVDSRTRLGPPLAKLAAGSTTTVPIAGLGGIPADASAVFVNLTVVNTSANPNYVTPFPADQPRPDLLMAYRKC